jgi:hypothetical protein
MQSTDKRVLVAFHTSEYRQACIHNVDKTQTAVEIGCHEGERAERGGEGEEGERERHLVSHVRQLNPQPSTFHSRPSTLYPQTPKPFCPRRTAGITTNILKNRTASILGIDIGEKVGEGYAGEKVGGIMQGGR